MPIDTEIIFNKPPATEVQIVVHFQNTLEVADHRGKYHALVKSEFPFVYMPDIRKLVNDFGDYSLRSENWTNNLEIGMNYFRLVTTNYPGFNQFRNLFLSSLSKFSDCYAINSFTQIAMQYTNKLALPSDRDFEDCFSIKIVVSENLQTPIYAGKGTLIFQQPEGLVIFELDPQLNGDMITSYIMTLSFAASRALSLSGEKESDVATLIDSAHEYIKKYFFSFLQEDYI